MPTASVAVTIRVAVAVLPETAKSSAFKPVTGSLKTKRKVTLSRPVTSVAGVRREIDVRVGGVVSVLISSGVEKPEIPTFRPET